MRRTAVSFGSSFIDGYTIIEVIIFLAVSGALLVSAGSLVGGRQEKIRFTQAVESMELQLQDTFNDVSTGFFPSIENFTCAYNGTATGFINIQPKTNGAERGTNNECIYVGKLLRFHSGNPEDSTKYEVYTLVGSRKYNENSYLTGQIKLLGFNPAIDGSVEYNQLGASLELPGSSSGTTTGIYDSSNGAMYHSLVILSDVNGQTPNSSSGANASRVKLYGYSRWDNANGVLLTDNIRGFSPIVGDAVICLRQGGGGRIAALEITPQLTIDRKVDQWPGLCGR